MEGLSQSVFFFPGDSTPEAEANKVWDSENKRRSHCVFFKPCAAMLSTLKSE